jgi:LPS-assembly protein
VSTLSWWRVLLAAVALLPALGGGAEAQPAPPQTPVTVGTAGGDVTVVADRLEQVGAENRVIATGNVEITRGRSRLMADRVEIDRATGEAIAEGRVVFYDGEDQLTGQRIEYNIKTGTGVVYQADARAEPNYRILGEEMERLGESVYRVRKGVFTTCEDDPPTWSFHFNRATANLNDYLFGTGASFWVKNVPLIPFFPFFAAAIRRERQTGFLFPKFGNSSSKGVYGEIPFYWVIDDSKDATIAPLYYSKRGGGLRADFRHIDGPEDLGHADLFFLQESGKEGSRFTGVVREDHTLGHRAWLRIDANGVSDDNVIRDYGDSILQRSTQRVESHAFATKSWDTWNLVGDLFVYQDLSTAQPVELWQLPALSLIGPRQPFFRDSGLLFQSSASFVHFVRDVGSSGSRLDVNPQISRPIPLGYLTVTPFVGGRLTGYDRTVTGTHIGRGDVLVEDTKDEPRLRRLVEAGADFESKISRIFNTGGWWGTEALLHTIEPRVRYTWVTGWDQDRLPQWSEGVDNIGDASRIEYSLTNRVRARTAAYPDAEAVRWEMLRLTLGHSYDTRFERVGDVFSTLIVRPKPGYNFRSDVNYNPVTGHFPNATADVSADLPSTTAVSVGIRYADAPAHVTFLQATLGTVLWNRVTLRSTLNWDLYRGDFTETSVAADFRWQCWALTVEYVNRARQDDEIRFAINLLGIGGPIGTSVGLGAIASGGQK